MASFAAPRRPDPDPAPDCLLRPDGTFVWSDRTRTKLGNDKEKLMRFLLQMLQLFYALMMGKDAMIDGTAFTGAGASNH